MSPIALSILASYAHATVHGDASRRVDNVSTDTRQVRAGDLFVALIGKKFDAHNFVPQAAAAGASAVMVSKIDPAWGTLPCPLLLVDDTLVALQLMASGYRQQHNPIIIGLTGSNGKTSTKDLTAVVMAKKFVTRATRGNLNNHIGVPLTLLSLQTGEQCCVTEMGMNHAGEIEVLTDIADPDAGIVTNIGLAHIENLGTQDAIAWEKATLPAKVKRNGIVVLNADDKYTPLIARHCQAVVSTAGIHAGDVRAYNLRADGGGTTFTLDFSGEKVEARLAILGEHMVANAALAACMGWRYGISPSDIAEALSHVVLTGGRLEPKIIQGVRFIDDSYNANPDSMIAGLRTLATLPGKGRRIAVLGRMGELGSIAEAEHKRVGKFVTDLGIDALFTVGGYEAEWISSAVTGLSARHFTDHAACAAHLRELLREGDFVLLKGSRTAAIEKVITHFQAS
ncbi:MAG: UDP-N-acetylmuramoyl-tripeptide--D-alanyl-D-alanine ligase [Prosthecobacter sp.]